MNNNAKKYLYIIVSLILAILVGVCAFNAGKSSGNTKLQEQYDELLKKQEELQQLNRSSIEKMIKEDGPIYVIGHRSPDSDTVCTAIAYARFLNMLGYEAQPRINDKVNNETAFILKEAGVEVPEELIDASGLNIFLVDHSEYAQATEGMVDAHIVGVIDHHGVGTLQTGNQVVYEAKPIGATATIVWLDYLNYGLEIDKTTAHLLLGAVLSDTGNLGGSTTTQADVAAVKELSVLAGIENVDEFYNKMHAEKISYKGMSNEEILFSDYKEYEAFGTKYGIGLVDSLNEESSKMLAEKMKEALKENFNKKDVDLMYASVGIREDGKKIDYIIPANELSESILKNAFPNYDEYDGTSYIFRSGLGRKTKFVPGLNEYLGAHPHE